MRKQITSKELSPRKKKFLKYKADKQRQKETYAFTRKFYRFLKSHQNHIFFKKLHMNVHGNYEPSTTNITVDYRRDFLSTLIHEYFHHIHPDWCETKVLRNEVKMINALSVRQAKNILKAWVKVL